MTENDNTSVRVAVRIRPQLPQEVIDMCHMCTNVTPGEPQVWLGSDKAFTYDYVFDTNSQQDEVYEHCVMELIEGCFHGYNATVLAYGQTGSGKTYSMGSGFDVNPQPEHIGIIPRALAHLFSGILKRREDCRSRGETAPEFKVHAQFLELYNEEIIDLLDNCRDNDYRGQHQSLRIHEDTEGGIYVLGATSQVVHSEQEALDYLRQGALCRSTASTAMNATSSRSHAIFTLFIRHHRVIPMENNNTENEDDVTTNNNTNGDGLSDLELLSAKFHFVDLAGSERLKRTQATGERAREGISINCGLLALGNVISALGDKSKRASHVPYRDSKLTRLLQDSLGGNSRTVMIACIAPSDIDFMETLNTLKYANRARNIKNRVTVNQDKSSRTITLLRQEIQKLQLDLMEYKQGKRVVNEDGVESINDMFHENTMLQCENNNLRTRIKALQETIDSLTVRNTELLVVRDLTDCIESGNDQAVSELVRGYLKEIEELRAKLLETQHQCDQLRKDKSRNSRPGSAFHNSPMMIHSVHPLMMDESRVDVLELLANAKRDVEKDRSYYEQLQLTIKMKENDREGGEEENGESSSEEEESETADPAYCQLAEVTSEISIKEKLMEELESSHRRMNMMKQQYEEKLQMLQLKIKITQDERDKVLANLTSNTATNTSNAKDDKSKKIKDEYERKISNMQQELRQLQAAKKQHAKQVRNQAEVERQLTKLKEEIGDMKKMKVKLMNKIREENKQRKEMELRNTKEVTQLRKQQLKKDNLIRSLEHDKKTKESVLRRKHDEIQALRQQNKGNMSSKAAGRLKKSKNKAFSPKAAKHQWQALEKSINQHALSKEATSLLQLDMERYLSKRDSLRKALDTLSRRKSIRDDPDINEEIESTKANIDYVQEKLKECQANIVQLEEAKDFLPESRQLTEGLNLEESSYLLEKLLHMTVHQTFLAQQNSAKVNELQIQMETTLRNNSVHQQLLNLVVVDKTSEILRDIGEGSGDTGMIHLDIDAQRSSESSRSTSPTGTVDIHYGGRVDSTRYNVTDKIRRRTATTEELLYSVQPVRKEFGIPERGEASLEDEKGSRFLTSNPMHCSLSKLNDRLPDVSPRSNRKLFTNHSTNYGHGNDPTPLLPSPTFTIPSPPIINTVTPLLIASPPGSPNMSRRNTTRVMDQEDVFDRLTSSVMLSKESIPDKGVITPYQGKIHPKDPLQCCHLAEGHSKAVLSICATDDYLISGSKDRSVKVWDLLTGQEMTSMQGHPNNVVAVQYSTQSRLVFSASSAYIRVWDIRCKPAEIVKTLSSTGMIVSDSTPLQSATRGQLPLGEATLNDIALSPSGLRLYTATADKVRIWDLSSNSFTPIAKLGVSHNAAIMKLAVTRGHVPLDDLVVTGSKDHYVKVFEVCESGCNVVPPKFNLDPPHYDGIQALAVNRKTLFTGSRDMCIKKWDVEKGELVQSMNNAHRDWVCSLCFLSRNQLLASVCRGGVVKLWNTETCQCVGNIRAHRTPINAVTSNRTHLFTAASNEIGIWRLKPSLEPVSTDATIHL